MVSIPLLGMFISAAYEVLGVTRWSATPGKKLFRMRIVRFGQIGVKPSIRNALARWGLLIGFPYLLLALSVGLYTIVFVWLIAVAVSIALRPDHRGIHDSLGRTVVVYASVRADGHGVES
jgi:uncharacterized RDD family membrane protein YckC